MEFSLKAKYEAWVGDGWKDGNNKQIKNWKTKLKNTLPYLKEVANVFGREDTRNYKA